MTVKATEILGDSTAQALIASGVGCVTASFCVLSPTEIKNYEVVLNLRPKLQVNVNGVELTDKFLDWLEMAHLEPRTYPLYGAGVFMDVIRNYEFHLDPSGRSFAMPVALARLLCQRDTSRRVYLLLRGAIERYSPYLLHLPDYNKRGVSDLRLALAMFQNHGGDIDFVQFRKTEPGVFDFAAKALNPELAISFQSLAAVLPDSREIAQEIVQRVSNRQPYKRFLKETLIHRYGSKSGTALYYLIQDKDLQLLHMRFNRFILNLDPNIYICLFEREKRQLISFIRSYEASFRYFQPDGISFLVNKIFWRSEFIDQIKILNLSVRRLISVLATIGSKVPNVHNFSETHFFSLLAETAFDLDQLERLKYNGNQPDFPFNFEDFSKERRIEMRLLQEVEIRDYGQSFGNCLKHYDPSRRRKSWFIVFRGANSEYLAELVLKSPRRMVLVEARGPLNAKLSNESSKLLQDFLDAINLKLAKPKSKRIQRPRLKMSHVTEALVVPRTTK
jgi:hypothetical protein